MPQGEGATAVDSLSSSGLPGFILRKRLLSFLLLLTPLGLHPGAGRVPVVRPLASVQSLWCGHTAGALCMQALGAGGSLQSWGDWPVPRMTGRCRAKWGPEQMASAPTPPPRSYRAGQGPWQ